MNVRKSTPVLLVPEIEPVLKFGTSGLCEELSKCRKAPRSVS